VNVPLAGCRGWTVNGSPFTTECIGPVAVPHGAMGTLHSLATEAGVDPFVALSVCAGVLAERLPRPGTDCRVRVTWGPSEVIIRSAGAPDPSTTFRDALGQAGTGAAPVGDDDDRPVDVTISIGRDGRQVYVETMTDSADLPSAQAWAHSFPQLLAGMANEPDAPMLGHPLVGAEERERILHGLNPQRDPRIRYRTLAEPFQEQVERTPDSVALQDEDGNTLSYRQLNERANRLAHYLREHGAGPGSRIGIFLQRGIHQVVASYAAVKAGATYVSR
jgi:hypothetical protein